MHIFFIVFLLLPAAFFKFSAASARAGVVSADGSGGCPHLMALGGQARHDGRGGLARVEQLSHELHIRVNVIEKFLIRRAKIV
jgi:hypothetical protein